MIGKKIHTYEIKSHLGEGGMGTVFRAGDSVLDRDVALKMLHTPLLQQPVFLERFKKEARVLAQLLHPNIAVIYNMIEQDDNHFMVMEYVEGKNLDALMRQYQTLSCKIVVPVFIQALEGLHHAHKKGIYHRDIKPANLILTSDGTVKLMDFGIAMVKGEQRLTQVNRVVGTIEYIAPEIIEGKQPSAATDIYAAGVTMYELLTGKLPFEGNTDYNLMQDILKKKPLSPDKMKASVPKALSTIVMKALEKKPEDRFINAKEFQQALIAAFPELKFAELNAAYVTETVKANIHTAIIEKSVKPKATSVAATRFDFAGKTSSLLTGLKEKITGRENRLVVISLSAVVVTVLATLMFMPSDNATPVQISRIQSAGTQSQTTEKTTSEKKRSENNGGPLPDQPNPDPVISLPQLPQEKISEDKADTKKKEEKKRKEDERKKEEDKKPAEEKKAEEKKIKIPSIEEKKAEPAPVESKVSKSVKLQSSVNVNLYLTEPLNAATAKEGQTIYFTVTGSVNYGGDVIIEKGATAKGRILSVGRKKIAIVIHSVTAATGQILPVQQEELSGRIEDMANNRNYSATIKRGITIHF